MIAATVACWAFYVFFVHTWMGQRHVVGPLLASDTRPFSRATVEVVWHAASFSLFCIVAVVTSAIWIENVSLLAAAATQVLGLFLAFLWIGPRRLGSGFALPQWILLGPLFVCIACIGLGYRGAGALIMSAIAVVHFAWALGVHWPSPSRDAAPAYVVGWPAGGPLPSRLLTALVGIALIGAVTAMLCEVPGARIGCTTVFTTRGLFGFIEKRVRPAIAGTPYAMLSRLFYSPLCLLIAALTGLGA